MREIKLSNQISSLPRHVAAVTTAVALMSVLFIGNVAAAASLDAGTSAAITTPTSSISSSTSSSVTANQQQRLQNIISKGNEEIDRRLTTLGTLTSKINAATKLTADDKAALSNEVSTTIQGLTGLKVQLDADTTLSAAHIDAKNIYTEYRVYALVAPKVSLIKVADDQQAIQANLTTLAQKLQSRITTEETSGKSIATLQNELNDMKSEIAAAHSISSSMEANVVNLQPSDYNSNHALLMGDSTQLQNAHSDDKTAYSDAKSIISTLKNM